MQENSIIFFNNLMGDYLSRNNTLTLFQNFSLKILSWHINNQPANLSIPEHEHANCELSFMLNGAMSTTCENHIIHTTMDNNNILLIPPGMLHHRQFSKHPENINISCTFCCGDEKLSTKNYRDISNVCINNNYTFTNMPMFQALRSEIFRQINGELNGANEILPLILTNFLSVFFQHFFLQKLEPEYQKDIFLAHNNKEKAILIKRRFLACMSEPNQLQTISKHLNLSVRHLNRILKNEIGMSMHTYLSQIRLEHAKSLLSDTNLTISEISKIVGFKSLVSFNVFFKRNCLIAPSLFRQQNLSQKSWK